jgi:chromosome segregation ATPase
MVLDNLGRADEKYYDKIARLRTQVKRLEREVAALGKNPGHEDTLESKEELLQAMRKSLAIHKKKLSDRKAVREQMATDLQKLETALEEVRQTQAKSRPDDTDYQRIRKELDALRDGIERLKTKRGPE